jgi:hypothetical protein
LKKNLHLIILTGLFLLNHAAFAQQSQQAFLESYGGTGTQEMFYKTSVLRSTDGYNYVSGATLNSSGNYDMLLTKMTGNNTVVWTQQYAGAAGGNDFAAELVQDGAGNIIITGTENISLTNYNAVTIKYNSAGVQQWIQSYNGAANSFDGGISVVRDASNNIYMCGGSYGTTTFSDFLCVKYNSSGVQQWATTWNGAGMQDISARLAISATRVSVIGASQQSVNDWKMATTFFDLNTGAFLGEKLTGGDDEGIDKVADLAIDASDNTYVVGAVRNINHQYDIKVIKLSPTYTVLWQQTFNGTDNLNDEGLSLELTSTNDVVICGFTSTTEENKNFVTRKYNGSSGSLIWSKTFDEQDGEDKATDLKLDANGNAIICGSSYKDGNLDYVVQKLKNTTGDIIWTGRWNGDYNLNDQPMNLAIDENDNTIYVAGQSEVGEGHYKYMVTRWSQKDVYMPKTTDRKHPNGFITNKGQLQNTDGTINTSIKYYQPAGWPSTYIDDAKISYVYTRGDTLPEDTLHRIDMSFEKGNDYAKIYPTQELPHYTNFYLGYMPNEKSERTAHYGSVTKLGAYANTDIIFTNHSQGYRTWIVARTGAPASDFTMHYEGQNSLSVDGNGDLVFGTIFGDIVQPSAKVYAMNNTTGVLTLLQWQPEYIINGGDVSFNYTGTWTGTLVIEMEKKMMLGGGALIDPGNIEWSTYYGEGQINRGFSIDHDEVGNIYSCGITQDPNFPLASSGPLTYSCPDGECTNYNAYFQKFDIGCIRKYSIVYGGTSNENATNLVYDPVINGVFVSGSGHSAAYETFPTMSAGSAYFLSEPPGNSPFFSYLTRFSSDYGTLKWGTFITTQAFFSYVDDRFPLAINSDGELYMCGGSGGLQGIELIGDGYLYDNTDVTYSPGFIIKFNLQQEITWSTEFGKGCRIRDAEVNPEKELIIGGSMHAYAEPDFPTEGPDGYWVQENFGGYYHDGFFTVFKPDNTIKWSTYFGGNEGSEQVSAISTTLNDIFISGRTPSTENFPLQAPSNPNQFYDEVNVGGDGFIAQFHDGTLVWSTFVGGDGEDEVKDVLARTQYEVYATGVTKSSNFPIEERAGAFNQSNLNTTGTSANYDAFLLTFNDMNLIWGTYLGGLQGASDFQERASELALYDTKLFIVGIGGSEVNFPWWDFDGEDLDIAYFDDFIENVSSDKCDAWICRLEIEDLTNVVDELNGFENSDFLVFPNPANNMLYMKLDKASHEAINISIVNAVGKVVYEINSLYAQSNLLTVPLDKLSCGIYIIRIWNRDKIYTSKFQKQ